MPIAATPLQCDLAAAMPTNIRAYFTPKLFVNTPPPLKQGLDNLVSEPGTLPQNPVFKLSIDDATRRPAVTYENSANFAPKIVRAQKFLGPPSGGVSRNYPIGVLMPQTVHQRIQELTGTLYSVTRNLRHEIIEASLALHSESPSVEIACNRIDNAIQQLELLTHVNDS